MEIIITASYRLPTLAEKGGLRSSSPSINQQHLGRKTAAAAAALASARPTVNDLGSSRSSTNGYHATPMRLRDSTTITGFGVSTTTADNSSGTTTSGAGYSDVHPTAVRAVCIGGHERCGIVARFLWGPPSAAAASSDGSGGCGESSSSSGGSNNHHHSTTSEQQQQRQVQQEAPRAPRRLVLELGRDPSQCDVVVPFTLPSGPLLSRRHCSLSMALADPFPSTPIISDGRATTATPSPSPSVCEITIQDHDSVNGTFLDNLRVGSHTSSNGVGVSVLPGQQQQHAVSISFDPAASPLLAQGKEPVCTLSFGGGRHVPPGQELPDDQLFLRFQVFVRVLSAGGGAAAAVAAPPSAAGKRANGSNNINGGSSRAPLEEEEASRRLSRWMVEALGGVRGTVEPPVVVGVEEEPPLAEDKASLTDVTAFAAIDLAGQEGAVEVEEREGIAIMSSDHSEGTDEKEEEESRKSRSSSAEPSRPLPPPRPPLPPKRSTVDALAQSAVASHKALGGDGMSAQPAAVGAASAVAADESKSMDFSHNGTGNTTNTNSSRSNSSSISIPVPSQHMEGPPASARSKLSPHSATPTTSTTATDGATATSTTGVAIHPPDALFDEEEPAVLVRRPDARRSSGGAMVVPAPGSPSAAPPPPPQQQQGEHEDNAGKGNQNSPAGNSPAPRRLRGEKEPLSLEDSVTARSVGRARRSAELFPVDGKHDVVIDEEEGEEEESELDLFALGPPRAHMTRPPHPSKIATAAADVVPMEPLQPDDHRHRHRHNNDSHSPSLEMQRSLSLSSFLSSQEHASRDGLGGGALLQRQKSGALPVPSLRASSSGATAATTTTTATATKNSNAASGDEKRISVRFRYRNGVLMHAGCGRDDGSDGDGKDNDSSGTDEIIVVACTPSITSPATPPQRPTTATVAARRTNASAAAASLPLLPPPRSLSLTGLAMTSAAAVVGARKNLANNSNTSKSKKKKKVDAPNASETVARFIDDLWQLRMPDPTAPTTAKAAKTASAQARRAAVADAGHVEVEVEEEEEAEDSPRATTCRPTITTTTNTNTTEVQPLPSLSLSQQQELEEAMRAHEAVTSGRVSHVTVSSDDSGTVSPAAAAATVRTPTRARARLARDQGEEDDNEEDDDDDVAIGAMFALGNYGGGSGSGGGGVSPAGRSTVKLSQRSPHGAFERAATTVLLPAARDTTTNTSARRFTARRVSFQVVADGRSDTAATSQPDGGEAEKEDDASVAPDGWFGSQSQFAFIPSQHHHPDDDSNRHSTGYDNGGIPGSALSQYETFLRSAHGSQRRSSHHSHSDSKSHTAAVQGSTGRVSSSHAAAAADGAVCKGTASKKSTTSASAAAVAAAALSRDESFLDTPAMSQRRLDFGLVTPPPPHPIAMAVTAVVVPVLAPSPSKTKKKSIIRGGKVAAAAVAEAVPISAPRASTSIALLSLPPRGGCAFRAARKSVSLRCRPSEATKRQERIAMVVTVISGSASNNSSKSGVLSSPSPLVSSLGVRNRCGGGGAAASAGMEPWCRASLHEPPPPPLLNRPLSLFDAAAVGESDEWFTGGDDINIDKDNTNVNDDADVVADFDPLFSTVRSRLVNPLNAGGHHHRGGSSSGGGGVQPALFAPAPLCSLLHRHQWAAVRFLWSWLMRPPVTAAQLEAAAAAAAASASAGSGDGAAPRLNLIGATPGLAGRPSSTAAAAVGRGGRKYNPFVTRADAAVVLQCRSSSSGTTTASSAVADLSGCGGGGGGGSTSLAAFALSQLFAPSSQRPTPVPAEGSSGSDAVGSSSSNHGKGTSRGSASAAAHSAVDASNKNEADADADADARAPRSCLLAHGPGLGKTLTTIAFLLNVWAFERLHAAAAAGAPPAFSFVWPPLSLCEARDVESDGCNHSNSGSGLGGIRRGARTVVLAANAAAMHSWVRELGRWPREAGEAEPITVFLFGAERTAASAGAAAAAEDASSEQRRGGINKAKYAAAADEARLELVRQWARSPSDRSVLLTTHAIFAKLIGKKINHSKKKVMKSGPQSTAASKAKKGPAAGSRKVAKAEADTSSNDDDGGEAPLLSPPPHESFWQDDLYNDGGDNSDVESGANAGNSSSEAPRRSPAPGTLLGGTDPDTEAEEEEKDEEERKERATATKEENSPRAACRRLLLDTCSLLVLDDAHRLVTARSALSEALACLPTGTLRLALTNRLPISSRANNSGNGDDNGGTGNGGGCCCCRATQTELFAMLQFVMPGVWLRPSDLATTLKNFREEEEEVEEERRRQQVIVKTNHRSDSSLPPPGGAMPLAIRAITHLRLPAALVATGALRPLVETTFIVNLSALQGGLFRDLVVCMSDPATADGEGGGDRGHANAATAVKRGRGGNTTITTTTAAAAGIAEVDRLTFATRAMLISNQCELVQDWCHRQGIDATSTAEAVEAYERAHARKDSAAWALASLLVPSVFDALEEANSEGKADENDSDSDSDSDSDDDDDDLASVTSVSRRSTQSGGKASKPAAPTTASQRRKRKRKPTARQSKAAALTEAAQKAQRLLLLEERLTSSLTHSWKMRALFLLLRGALQPRGTSTDNDNTDDTTHQENIVIFSHSLRSLVLVGVLLGHCCGYTDGLDFALVTASLRQKRRQELCDAFNSNDNRLSILLLPFAAAPSLGVDLSGADRVVFFDAAPDATAEREAIGRVRRLGLSRASSVGVAGSLTGSPSPLQPVYVNRLMSNEPVELQTIPLKSLRSAQARIALHQQQQHQQQWGRSKAGEVVSSSSSDPPGDEAATATAIRDLLEDLAEFRIVPGLTEEEEEEDDGDSDGDSDSNGSEHAPRKRERKTVNARRSLSPAPRPTLTLASIGAFKKQGDKQRELRSRSRSSTPPPPPPPTNVTPTPRPSLTVPPGKKWARTDAEDGDHGKGAGAATPASSMPLVMVDMLGYIDRAARRRADRERGVSSTAIPPSTPTRARAPFNSKKTSTTTTTATMTPQLAPDSGGNTAGEEDPIATFMRGHAAELNHSVAAWFPDRRLT